MSKELQMFLRGFGSTLDVFGVSDCPSSRRREHVARVLRYGFDDDAAAIAHDMKTAISEFSASQRDE